MLEVTKSVMPLLHSAADRPLIGATRKLVFWFVTSDVCPVG